MTGDLSVNTSSGTGSPFIPLNQNNVRRAFIQYNNSNTSLRLANEYGGLELLTGVGGSEVTRVEITSDGLVKVDGVVINIKSTSLGTNDTTLDAESVRELNVTSATYTASTTLTLSNVTNLRRFAMQLTNTNANTITFSGITLYFKSDDLPSGVSFASNALTFPADSAVKYNLVGEAFDGSTFDCKIEIR